MESDIKRITVESHTINIETLDNNSTIIDLGANHGKFSDYIYNNFKCKVVAYEPTLHLYKNLINNKYTVYNKAVAGIDTFVNFYEFGGNDEGNSILKHTKYYESGKFKEHDRKLINTYKVEVIGINTLLSVYSEIDILKIDIEGAEIDLLENITKQNALKCKQITVEFHHKWGDVFNPPLKKEDTDRVIHILKSYGFQYETFDNEYIDCLFTNEKNNIHVSLK